MKRQYITAIIIGLLILALPAAAADITGRYMTGLHAGGGLTWPGGDLNDDYDGKSAPNWNVAGGLSLAWAPFSFGAVCLGAEYSYDNLSVKINQSGAEIRETKSLLQAQALLGWKGFVSLLYYEAGFLCTIPAGPWKSTADIDGEKTAPVLGPNGSVDASYKNIGYGIYLGMGVIYWLSDSLALEGGLQFRGTFNDIYRNVDNDNDHRLRYRAIMLRTGAIFCF